MKKLLKNVLVPYAGNDYHPHATRHNTLLMYCLAFLLANYVIFPVLGFDKHTTLAANIDADELISLANKERKNLGLTTLSQNENLSRAALAKGNDMLKKQYWSHFGPNGETPWQFITDAGYNYVYAGENLAKDFQTSLDTHLAWMNSKTHRDNIVNSNFKDVGIAIVSGQFQGYSSTIVVQMFGSEEMPVKKEDPPSSVVGSNSSTNPNPQDPLPTILPLTPPTINKPIEGNVFSSQEITIEGTVVEGNTLKVFSNNKVIGELPNEGAAFNINAKLEEGKNTIFMRSKDSNTGRESGDSNRVNVEIDSTPPIIEKIRFQIYRQNKNIYVSVASEEELARVSFVIDQTEGEFIKKGNNFEVKFHQDSIINPKALVIFYDMAGNSSEKYYDLNDSSYDTTTLPIILRTSISGGIGGIFGNIQSLSTTQKINLVFIIIIAIIMLCDAVILIKRGIKRERGSYHSFNFAIILITIVGLLTLFR